MAVAGRFDLEEARREAQAAKRAARIRSIVSNVTLVVVLLVVGIGGKIGWDKGQEKREADRAAAEAAQIAEEKAKAEQKRAEAEKAKVLAEKREAERKAREEAREAERKARVEAREREKREREEEKLRVEERRRAEAEFRAEQQELKKFEDAQIAALDFRPETHVCFEYGLEKALRISVDESKWGTLSSHSQKRRTAEFLEALRDDTVTNVITDTCYPDRATFDHLIANLAATRFTLVANVSDDAMDRKIAIVVADVEKGLAAPEGMRALKSGGKVSGWTVPFAYGDKYPIFVLDQSTADRFAREWSQFRRKVRSDAAKLDNKDEFVASKLAKELPEFVRTVRIEVTSVPVETSKKDNVKKQDTKKKPLMKGSNSDMRRMSGPQRR
jgi:hypothetical protein